MNARWTVQEERNLIQDIKNNKSFQELAPKYNRTPNALELRIKKIVYDNISANKSIDMIGGHLNLPTDKVKQYFYSYKEMLEKRGMKPLAEGSLSNNNNNIDNKIENDTKTNIIKENSVVNKLVNQKGGDNNINNIRNENEVFNDILKNISMRKKLKKLLKEGKLNNNMKKILRNLLK